MVQSVLLVDDDPSALRLFEIYLGKTYDIHCAATAHDAAEAIANTSFDLVIMDIMLPDRSGFELLASIKTHHPRTRVIIVTGLSSDDTQERAVIMGADQVIVKPVTPEALKRVIEKLTSA